MEWISGNIFIRPNTLARAGEAVEGHTHNFDHTTIVFTGAVHVKAVLPNGSVVEQDFVAPAHFLVRAHVKHEIRANMDGTVFWCVYAHRSPQGDVTQQYSGWLEAYS